MDGPSALFPVANAFYIGAYQAAINEAQDLGPGLLTDTEVTERDTFVYRSYVALGQHALVTAEIGDSSPTALQAVRLLAVYLSDASQKESVVAQLGELLADPACANNQMLLLMAATVYAHEGNYNEALKCCHTGSTLEHMALMVQLLCEINRADMADKKLRQMSATDDDATLTQLATATVNVALGGSKVQEASYIFQELGDKYQWTVKLYNGMALCHMTMESYDDAEKDLLEALNKDSKDADTLASLIVCSLHLGKPTTRVVAQLKAVAPAHPMLEKLGSMDTAFEHASNGFS